MSDEEIAPPDYAALGWDEDMTRRNERSLAIVNARRRKQQAIAAAKRLGDTAREDSARRAAGKGIPPSVYATLLPGKKYADGGKVGGLKKLLAGWRKNDPSFVDYLTRHHDEPAADIHKIVGDYGENTDDYARMLKDWDPEVSLHEYDTLGRHSLGSWGMSPAQIDALQELYRRVGFNPEKHRLVHRGVAFPDNVDLRDLIKSRGTFTLAPTTKSPMVSTSTNYHTAREFLDSMSDVVSGRNNALFEIVNGPHRVLPQPLSGQSELLMPLDAEFRLMDKSYDDMDDAHKFTLERTKAEGGLVSEDTKTEKALARLSKWLDEDGGYYGKGKDSKSAKRRLKQLIAGFTSQLAGVTPDGKHIAFGERPGLIPNTLSLKSLFEGEEGGPGTEADKEMGEIRRMVRDHLNVGEPEGILENISSMTGEMGGQIPLPGGAIKSLATNVGKFAGPLTKSIHVWGPLAKTGRALNTAGEMFTPTIDPKASNYLLASLLGGGLGSLGGGSAPAPVAPASPPAPAAPQPQVQTPAQPEGDDAMSHGGLARLSAKYAGGGKVAGVSRMMAAVKEAIAHLDNRDFASAAAALKQSPELMTDPSMSGLVRMLSNPSTARSARAKMDSMVEADTNTRVPLMAKGGKIRGLKVLKDAIAGASSPPEVPAPVRDYLSRNGFEDIEGMSPTERALFEIGGQFSNEMPVHQDIASIAESLGDPSTDKRLKRLIDKIRKHGDPEHPKFYDDSTQDAFADLAGMASKMAEGRGHVRKNFDWTTGGEAEPGLWQAGIMRADGTGITDPEELAAAAKQLGVTINEVVDDGVFHVTLDDPKLEGRIKQTGGVTRKKGGYQLEIDMP